MPAISALSIGLLLLALILVAIGWIALRRVTIGIVNGRAVRMCEWFNSNTRLLLRVAKANQSLKTCLALPPEQQLSSLLELELTYGEVFVAGDKIRRAIVAMGRDESLPSIRRWLQSVPHLGQSALISGTQDALRSGCATDHFKVQVFQMLLPGLNGSGDWYTVHGSKVAGLLLDIDGAWGERVLKSPEYLDPDHVLFNDILNAFSRRGIEVPQSSIAAWLARWNKDDLSYAEGLKAIETLKALSFHDEATADAGLHKLALRLDSVGTAAAEVLLEMRGLPHPTFRLSDKAEKDGGASLNYHERAAWLVDLYNYAVSSEGLYKFEYHETGNHLIEMVAALREIRSPNHAKRLEAFCALFGPAGPPKDVRSRSNYVDDRRVEWNEAREALDSRFGELENTRWLLFHYILNHAEHFDRVPRRVVAVDDDTDPDVEL